MGKKKMKGEKKNLTNNKLEILENVTSPTLSSWLVCCDKLALVSFAIRSETAGTVPHFTSGATPEPQKAHRTARKMLLLLVLCMSGNAGTVKRLLSCCTVIYGNSAQGVLRAQESWCHKVASERLVERCPAICVYANGKTRLAAAHTHSYVFRTRSFHLFLLPLCLSICNSSALLPPLHCLMQLFSPDRSDQSFLLTSDSI